MALTQEQKTTISEISQHPQNIMEDFKKRPYYLQSFKNEFFQDGTGLLDKILYQYFLTDDNIYLELYQYVVNHSPITITDNKGNKPSALSYLYNLKSSFDNFSLKFDNVIEVSNIENIDYHSYIIEKHIINLYSEGYKDLAIKNLKKISDSIEPSKSFIHVLIKNDDIDFFKDIYLFQKEKNATNVRPYLSLTLPDKSMLYFCLENKAEKIAEYLLNIDSSIVLNEKPTIASAPKSFPPILLIAKNSKLFDKLVSSMSYKQLVSNLNYSTANNSRFLCELLNSEYSDFIEQKLIETLNSNIENYEKINLLKSVFESNISYDKKFFIFTSGLDENVKETFSHIAIFNSFIFSIQREPNIEQNLFDQFINEFKLRDLISADYIFNNEFFTNMEYFKIISKNHVFNKINPLDFVESFLKNNKSKIVSDDTDYIWFKIAKLNFKNLNGSSKALNALNLMLVNNLDKYVNFFNEENLSLLLKENFNLASYRKDISSKDFFEVLDKLINTGFSFKEDSNKFLKLLSFNPPYSLLDKIIEKNTINIEQLSQQSSFWNNINNQTIFDYCIAHKASLNNPEYILSLVYNYENLPLELYLKNNGNVNYQSDKGNILHELCQDNSQVYDNEILLLLDFHPELSVQTNKQNKFAVSYLISDFNKLCKKYKDKSSQHKQSLAKYYKVIKAMFSCGLYSENKKAFNTLESQLLKYTDILDICPDLLPTLRAEKLYKKLEVKGVKSKTVKI